MTVDLREQLREAEAELVAAREAFQNVPPDRGGKITDWPEFRRAEAALDRVEALRAALNGGPPPRASDLCVGCGAPGTPTRETSVGEGTVKHRVRVRRCGACETAVAAYLDDVKARRRARSGSPSPSAAREPARASTPASRGDRGALLDLLGV